MGAQGSVPPAELHLNAERQRCSAAIEFVFDLVWHSTEDLQCEKIHPTSDCVPESTAHQHQSCAAAFKSATGVTPPPGSVAVGHLRLYMHLQKIKLLIAGDVVSVELR